MPEEPKAHHIPLRGIIAPVFIALAIAAGALDLGLNAPVLVWLSLLFLALGLVFARDASRLLAGSFKTDPAGSARRHDRQARPGWIFEGL